MFFKQHYKITKQITHPINHVHVHCFSHSLWSDTEVCTWWT